MPQVYHFEWRLDAAPTALWPYVSDTQRLNAAIGLPEWRFKDEAGAKGFKRSGEFAFMGVLPIKWEEKPFEWVEGRELGVERLYETGPIKLLRSHVKLVSEGEGTRLQHSLEFEPRAPLWTPVAWLEIGVKARRGLDKVYRWIDQFLKGSVAQAYPSRRPTLARGVGPRIADARARLEIADGMPADLIERVVRHLVEADDRALARIRPLELADRWSVDRATLLRVYLRATARGLFCMAWDIICPSCRGAKARVEELERLATEAHCASCDVRIDTRAERSLELVFTPSTRIRALDVRTHCVGGPGNTPHVVLQRRLAPREKLLVGAALAPGTYRLRGPGVEKPAFLKASAKTTDARATFKIAGGALAPEEAATAPVCEIELTNEDSRERLLLLERTDWHDDAVTIGRAYSIQDFVELFPGQVPPPEVGLTVERLAILALATDLERSLLGLDPDERVNVGRDAGAIVVDFARGRGGALFRGEPDAPRGVTLVSFASVGDAVAAGLAILTALARYAQDRDLLPLEARASVEASPCVAAAREGRPVVRGDAIVEALALLPAAPIGEIVLARPLAEEAAAEIGAARASRSILAATPTRPELARVRPAEPERPVEPARVKRAEETTHEDASGVLRYEDLEIGDTIGRGATSVVRLARHKRDGRRFAIKLQHAPEDRARSRWERELRAYSKLEGVPGILPVRGHGTEGFELWMALDYIEGETLADRLATKGRMKAREAAGVLARIARALHAAHTRGVIHRDVKPGNVVVDAEGKAWLLDFGIARFQGEEKGPSGLYAGTIGYLPPEAFDEPPVLDARSDVYSLGVTFFELVSGRMPFQGANGNEFVVQVVSRSSPLLHEVASDATEQAAAIARCALRKLSRERYRTAGDLALDLELFAQGQTPLHAPPIGDESNTTFRFRDLFFRRGLESAERVKSSDEPSS